MNRRQHHRSIPSKGELRTEVMGSQNTAPAPHAGRVGATPTSTSDGHRAPGTRHPPKGAATCQGQRRYAAGLAARHPPPHHCARHTHARQTRPAAHESSEDTGPLTSTHARHWRHRLQPEPHAAHAAGNRSYPASRGTWTTATTGQHTSAQATSGATSAQQARQRTSTTREGGARPLSDPRRTTAGEVSGGREGFRIFKDATKRQFQTTGRADVSHG